MPEFPSLVIVGLDGASFELIDPWLKAGDLPVLAALQERGARSVLLSTPQPVSAPAWTTVLTGKNPGGHGVFGFSRPRAADYRIEIINATHCRAQTLWQIVNRHGLRAGCVGVPMTYPPGSIDGFLVAGFDAPTRGQPIASPPEALAQFRQATGEEYCHVQPQLVPGEPVPWPALERSVRHVGTLTKLLWREHRPHVLMAVYSASDHAQHAYWQCRRAVLQDGGETEDVLRDTYRLIDANLGDLLAAAAGEDTDVLVISDHGAQALEGQLNIDNWLRQAGLLVRPAASGAGASLKHRAALGARTVARKILPGAVADALSRRFARQRSELARSLMAQSIDFARTRVFATDSFGSLRLNIIGREAVGAIRPEEREAAEREITEALLAIRHPQTGEQVIEQVVRGSELYHGPYVDEGPDLVAVPAGYRYVLRTNLVSTVAGVAALAQEAIWEDAPLGEHNRHGILLAAGPRIAPGAQVDAPSLQDLAPTALHLLGLPVPEDMDGRPLLEMLSAPGEVQRESQVAPAPAEVAAYTEQEQAEVEERLRNLGYM